MAYTLISFIGTGMYKHIEKEKTGVWMVVSKDNPNMKGSILNYNDVPANKKVGDTIKLSIKSSKNFNNVIFMYEPQKN